MIILWSVRTAHKKELEVVFNKPAYLFGNKAGDAWKMHKFLCIWRQKSDIKIHKQLYFSSYIGL